MTSAIGALKAVLQEENAVIRAAHFAGAGGNEVVQRRTSLIDRILREVHSGLSKSGPVPAIVAIGGYGRGELNPGSDIDIMLLCGDEKDRARSSDVLYPLWDVGLDVGYSVRTVKECVSLARQDTKIRTSLLESRLVAGDPGLNSAYEHSLRSDILYWRAASFIREKISERMATRRKYGGSIYLREPNIKEGEGGLRDVHTAIWIAFVHYQVSSLEALVEQGILPRTRYASFLRSRNFLWRVRNEIHYLSGRKNDHLTFDLQEQAARDFHYRDSDRLLAVERFMKSYFLHARTIREFAAAVSDAVLRKRRWSWFERKTEIGPFSLMGRTLVPRSEQFCKHDPAQMLAAFEIVQTRHAVLSDGMKEAIRACRMDDRARSSSAAAASFLAILNNPENLAETLTLMKDLRLLGRYLPEFRAIQALARHDFYHLYTVDEHILLAIRNLETVWTGLYPGPATITDAFKGLKKRWVLMLAVLIHDLGKAYREDHEHEGAKIAETILDRLGVTGEDRKRVVFLVENHLVMSSLSQRRELTDRKVIIDFARLVKDRETLALLYLLTYADISAVNPTAWTQWKAVLLQDLYLRALHYIDKNAVVSDEDEARLAALIDKARTAAAGQFTFAEIDAFITAMPDHYFARTSTRKILDHLSMMRQLREEQLVIRHRHNRERGYTELTVCAFDAYGMFYRTAGAIAAQNLNVLRAQVYTSNNGIMLDTFQITDADGRICDYEKAWESVHEELRSALTNRSRPPEPGRYGRNARQGFVVPAKIEFDNDSSENFTIIDVTAADRIGLLYGITKTLYDLNLDIGSAKIVTEGTKALDSFYVTDLLREKIVDEGRLEKIRDAVRAVMERA
jgi:[protein-PII] uridylyltransferase